MCIYIVRTRYLSETVASLLLMPDSAVIHSAQAAAPRVQVRRAHTSSLLSHPPIRF
jgi:hypothetical protein